MWPSGYIIHLLGSWYSDNGLLTHYRLVRRMGNLDLFVWVLTSHLFGAYAPSETIGQYNRNLIIKYILFIHVSETYTLIIVNTMTFHAVCFIIIIRWLGRRSFIDCSETKTLKKRYTWIPYRMVIITARVLCARDRSIMETYVNALSM